MKRIVRQKLRGMTLIEVVTALGVFTVIIMAVAQIMAMSAKTYRGEKLIQVNLQSAQFVLNTMAKELRTSSVVDSSSGATTSTITFFDYSQNRCIQYRADESAGTLSRRMRSFTAADPNQNRTDCDNYSFTESYESLVTNLTNQAFSVDPSTDGADPSVGRVTVALTLGTGGARSTIQTTVSLRDFNYSGI